MNGVDNIENHYGHAHSNVRSSGTLEPGFTGTHYVYLRSPQPLQQQQHAVNTTSTTNYSNNNSSSSNNNNDGPFGYMTRTGLFQNNITLNSGSNDEMSICGNDDNTFNGNNNNDNNFAGGFQNQDKSFQQTSRS
eukprot:Awhi_evm1s11018